MKLPPGDLHIATTDAGRPLTVRVELSAHDRGGAHETIYHGPTPVPCWRLSVTSYEWKRDCSDIEGGGATTDYIRQAARRPEPKFGPWELHALAKLGDRWHLNDLQAACAHQTVVWEDGRYGRQPSLELTEPCPETGYRYGSAWLTEPLPDDVLWTAMTWHRRCWGSVPVVQA